MYIPEVYLYQNTITLAHASIFCFPLCCHAKKQKHVKAMSNQMIYYTSSFPGKAPESFTNY